MNKLTLYSFFKAFEQCKNNPNYKVGIYISDRVRRRDFWDFSYEIVKQIRLDNMTISTDLTGPLPRICFANGSCIAMAEISFRGLRFNSLLYDEDTPRETLEKLNVVFFCMKIPGTKRCGVYDEADGICATDDETALNDFLSSFKVT